MRSILVALAVAALALGGPGSAAQAAGTGDAPTVAAVLTPGQLGLPDPAQGFYPYFTATGFTAPSGLGLGAGLLPGPFGPHTLFNGFGCCGLFSALFCPFFSAVPFTNTFISQGNLGPTRISLAGLPLFGFGPFFGLGSLVGTVR